MTTVPCNPPPAGSTLTTTTTTFGSCEGSHAPLFRVCAGVEAEHALVHLSVLLRSADAANNQACDLVDAQTRHLLWATRNALDMSKGLVEALLLSIESST